MTEKAVKTLPTKPQANQWANAYRRENRARHPDACVFVSRCNFRGVTQREATGPVSKSFALIREIRVNVRSGSPCFKICVRFEFARLR